MNITGSYILLIQVPVSSPIIIGKLGEIFFKEGQYLYVGSALSGIHQRVQRHLRSEKKMHWHIDYLLQNAHIQKVYYRVSDVKEECLIAQYFLKMFDYIIGFGCSDCQCHSHLFYMGRKDVRQIIQDVGFKEYNKNA